MTNPNVPKTTDANDPGIETEALDGEPAEEKPSSRILAQRAIIASEAYWGIGIGDPDRRYSRHMEPW